MDNFSNMCHFETQKYLRLEFLAVREVDFEVWTNEMNGECLYLEFLAARVLSCSAKLHVVVRGL